MVVVVTPEEEGATTPVTSRHMRAILSGAAHQEIIA